MKKILASLIFCCQFFCIGGMSPEKLIDEYRKSRNTSNLKKTQEFITQIKKQIIIPEIEKISVLGDMHDANIRRFLQLCGQEDNITEVRFINASTLITGLNIPQERKNYFLSMLNQEDRTETIIRELASSAYFIDEKDGFISCMDRMVRGKTKEQIREIQKNMRDYICSSVQEDIAFRTQILSHVTEGCENSKIYGDLIIALLASNEAPRNICRSLDTDSCYTRDKMTFIHSSENVGGYKAISFSEQVGYVRSFFHNASSIPLLNGFYGIELPPEMVIFHECGHALDFFNVILERMKLCRYLPDHILYKIIGKFIESILDDKAFASELDFLMSQNKEYFFGQQFSDISLLKEALMEELIFYILNKNNFETYALNSEKWGNDTTFCLSAFKERVTDKFASLVYRTNWLMDTMEEAWQILGLSYIESGDRRILYINELSDFALYSKMRYPLRADHWGISNLGDTPEELFVTYKFNPEVYDALLRIHASSLEQYSLRLMYPQGRLSFEYFLLNRHIASQYTEVLKTKIEQDRREISLNMDKN